MNGYVRRSPLEHFRFDVNRRWLAILSEGLAWDCEPRSSAFHAWYVFRF